MFSLGHLECSFDNPVEMFSRKSRKFFSQCPWLIKKGRKNQKNPSKFSKVHVEGDFDNSTLKNVNKRQKLLRSMSKIEMKKTFLRISVFLGNVRMESSFGSPAENFLTITEKFSLNPCFFWKTSFCWEKNFFSSKCFYGHAVTKFDNQGETIPEEVEQLQQRPKVMKQYFFQKNSSKCSCGQVECSFDNPAETFQERGINFSTESPKMMEN